MQKAVSRRKDGDRPSESDWYHQSIVRVFLLAAYCFLFTLCLRVSVADIT
jgi:hypothetical protein